MAKKAGNGEGYALDLSSPARHLRTALDSAAPAAVSIREVAKGYKHVVNSDLYRIRRHEGCSSDAEARVWVLAHAARQMSRWLDIDQKDDDIVVQLKPGKSTDSLRLNGSRVLPDIDDTAVLGDPFNRNRDFAVNLRDPKGADNLDELRESMRTFGWIPELPAVQDERGILLMGHRRMKVAQELNDEGIAITPVIKTIVFGDGDTADVKRLGLALASNLGGKPMTPTDRKRIALNLYGEHGFSMQKIGEILQVTKMTISRDLEGLSHDVTTYRPKGGRPKGSKSKKDPTTERQKIAADRKKEIEAAFERGEPIAKVAERLEYNKDKTGKASTRTVAAQYQRLQAAAEARVAALAAPPAPEPEPPATPIPEDPETLPAPAVRHVCPHCKGLGYIEEPQS